MSTNSIAVTDEATARRGPMRRMSDHGAKIAASRLGITVNEYRQHEADDEFWCGLGRHWVTRDAFHWTSGANKGRGGRCAACDRADGRRRYHERTVAFHAAIRVSLTPSGATVSRVPSAAASEGRPDAASAGDDARRSTGHLNCPPSIRHLCLGQLPEGWVWAAKP